MDYEKKYKEALERAKEIKSKILYSHLSTESCKAVSEYIDTIIPELTESEDERMADMVLKALDAPDAQSCIESWGINSKDVKNWFRAYLEKQKEIASCGIDEFTLTLKNCLSADSELTKEQAEVFAEAYGEELLNVAVGKIKSSLTEDDIIAFKAEKQKKQKSVVEVLAKAGLKSYRDGNQWCILAGDNIQEGICEFGNTVDDALYNFLMEVLNMQKEQKPTEPSDDELQRHQDELYDFKVFAAKQAREHHISFVHDFEWNNFCAELLSYFNEKQKPAEKLSKEEYVKKFKALCDAYEIKLPNREYDIYGLCKDLHKLFGDIQKPAEWSGTNDLVFRDICEHLEEEEYGEWVVLLKALRDGKFQVKQEWSEEDERNFYWISTTIQERHLTPEYTQQVHKILSWLKSLRPAWKPSEEQLAALQVAAIESKTDFQTLTSLLTDLKKL